MREMLVVLVIAVPADHRRAVLRIFRHQAGGAAHPAMDQIGLFPLDQLAQTVFLPGPETSLQRRALNAQPGAAEFIAPQGLGMQHHTLLHPRFMQAQHDVGRVQLGPAIAARRQ